MRDVELHELEEELELEDESEFEEESEGIFGAIGNVLGNLLGESETEYETHEHELEHGELGLHEYEHGELHEFEHGELGLHEYEHGELHELEHGELGLHEYEHGELHELEHGELGLHESEHGELHELEHGEMFFKSIGSFIRRAAPMLQRIARVAVPMVTNAVGGPLGGILGKLAGGVLGEGELEYEDEFELEAETHEYESHMAAPLTEHQALAELMAAVAAEAHTESEAEAMIGAATVHSLSARERRELRRVLAHLVRGSAILTRLLRRRRITRPAVRVVPTIVHATADTLVRRAATGQPVTRRTAGRVMAAHTRRVLSSPHVCGMAIQRNVRATRAIQARTGIPTVSWSPSPTTVRRARAASRTTARRAMR